MNIWQLMLFIFMYKLVIVELSKINNTIMFFRHNFQNLKSYPKKYNNISYLYETSWAALSGIFSTDNNRHQCQKQKPEVHFFIVIF